MSFEMRVLGSIELDRDGAAVSLGPAKRRAMFAALALDANRPVSLDRLSEALWAGQPPGSAVANLRTHATGLRRHLGDRLVARPRAYLLRVEEGELDVDRSTALVARGRAALTGGDAASAVSSFAAALGLWRGRVGQDLPVGTPLHRRFAALDDQRLAVFEDYVQARMSLEPRADVVSELRAHLARHPLRERAWGQLMLALYRAGDAAAALTAYRQARSALREDLGIEPGPELGILQRAILDRAPRLSAVVPRAVVRPDAPRSLPPDLATFVGRAGALAALDSALRAAAAAAGPSVIAISGAGGAGKSTLAVRAARLAADAFPDGQLWVDLRGSRPRLQHVGTGEALGRLLRALGVAPHAVPPTTDERAATYRSVLAGRKVLVLCDNAVDATQVRPLIPTGAGSALLVTSRCRMATLDGSTYLEVGPMSDASALALLAALAGADRVAAERLAAERVVRRCAGLPLALRIIGARLVGRPDWPLAVLADKLADGPTLLDELTCDDLSLRACFDAGYQPLVTGDEVAARAFRLLGTLPPGEAAPHSVARWLGVGVPAAGRILERLVDARLLEYVRPGRYRISDLLHGYAAELAAATEPPGSGPTRRVGLAAVAGAGSGAGRLGADRMDQLPA